MNNTQCDNQQPQKDTSQFQINHNPQHIKQQFTINDNIQTQQIQKPQTQIQHNQDTPLSPKIQNSLQPQTQSQTSSKFNKYQNQHSSFNKKQLCCGIFITVIITLILSSLLDVGAYFIVLKGYFNTNSQTNNLSVQSSHLTQAFAPNLSVNQALVRQQQMEQNWIYFEKPAGIDTFKFDTLKQTVMSFSHIIPKQLKARYIKLVIYDYSYNTQKLYGFLFKTRVINGKNEWVHWNFGVRQGAAIWSYDHQQFIVPCQQARQIRVKSDTIQVNSGVDYYIIGYKL